MKVKPVKVIKSCVNCVNNVEDPPAHTCDFCESLDTPDYYMWESKIKILKKVNPNLWILKEV